MKIDERINQVYLQNSTSHKVKQLDTTAKSQGSVKVEGDTIQLSSQSKKIKEYTQMAKTYEANSTDDVNRIKKQLADGTYEISTGKIADALINQFKK